MYFVLSVRVTYLFAFHCYGVYAIGGGLEDINHDKRKYDTSMNKCKGPHSFEEAWKPSTVSSVASYNTVSEFNSDIVTGSLMMEV